jgi:hypothetical protein
MIDRGGGNAAVQQQAQQPVTAVFTVYLVAVTEKKPAPLKGYDRWTGVDFGPEPPAKDVPQVKVVVAFEVYQAATGPDQRLKRINHLVELAEGVRGKTEPEVEQVAHDIQGIRGTFQLVQELQQQAVIPVTGGRQMGIGKKDRTHGGIVLSLPAEVNREER